MNTKQLIMLIGQIAKLLGIDPNLCLAIAGHETNFDNYKTRYEPKWAYMEDPQKYATLLGITVGTETIHQSTSWGAMQIMGAVCRELGYDGQLPRLIEPQLSILFSCRKLKSIQVKYSNLNDQIAAYNAGSPVKINGVYKNKNYIDDIVKRMNVLKAVH